EPRTNPMLAGPAAQPEADESDRSNADLCELPKNQRIPLAETVSEVARQRAEHRPRCVKKDGQPEDGLGFVQCLLIDGEKHRRGVNGLIVEGGEELGHQQPDKGPRTKVLGRLKGRHDLPSRMTSSRAEKLLYGNNAGCGAVRGASNKARHRSL